MVLFNEKDHTYTTGSGERFISATQLIGRYTPPFDAHYWSTYKAMKEVLEAKGEWDDYKRKCGGWSNVVTYVRAIDTSFPYRTEVMDVKKRFLAEWEAKRDDAAEKGTGYHKMMEAKVISSGYVSKGVSFGVAEEDEVHPLKHTDFTTNAVYTELVLWDEDYQVAGQADLVIKKGKKISIIDYKTSKEIKKDGFMGATMNYPVHEFPDANFSKFTLQLSLYASMLEKKGYEIEALQINHVDKETFEDIEKYPIDYKRTEIKELLEHYFESTGKHKALGKHTVSEEGMDQDLIVH